MMDFWNTVRGVELAETLIRELPELTRNKKQKIVNVEELKSGFDLNNYLEDGWLIKTSFVQNGATYVVLER